MSNKMLSLALSLAVLLALGVAATEFAPQPAGPEAPVKKEQRNALEVLKADVNYSILVAAVQGTEVEHILQDRKGITFFAPLNEAFERVPKLAELLADKPRLTAVLKRHVIPNYVIALNRLRELEAVQPLEGEILEIEQGDKHLEINDAKILVPDVPAANGIVHGIDHVLMKNNDSMLREAGAAIERSLKHAAEEVGDAFGDTENAETSKPDGASAKTPDEPQAGEMDGARK
ncbi:MAG: fasciclin domain-containing protein [Planctomycetota bacterium]|nr:fasciclin domain-containing protein [Planctomycetota bacterium]